MDSIQTEIPVKFNLPRRLNRLGKLAYNLWWVWNPDGQRLFQFIDRLLWDQVSHNPVAFLHQVERPRLVAGPHDQEPHMDAQGGQPFADQVAPAGFIRLDTDKFKYPLLQLGIMDPDRCRPHLVPIQYQVI